jgi:benzoate/toluate 1,2-dioxygenase reductase subunit
MLPPEKRRTRFLHSGKIVKRRRISEQAFEIDITRPETVYFEPGSVIKIAFEGTEQYYSPVSAPRDPTIVLHLRHGKEDPLSHKLALCGTEASVQVSGPFGYFSFRSSSRPPVFVAAGPGIAPFVSMGRSGLKDFILIHEVSSVDDLAYEGLFRKIARRYIPCVSESNISGVVKGEMFFGKVTDYMAKHLQAGAYDFYLSGKRELIRDVVWFIDDQFPGSHIYTEIFCCS